MLSSPLQKLNWCSLLGPGHAPGSRPQLLVSVSLEEEEERQPTEGGGAGEGLLVREPSALADDTGEWCMGSVYSIAD